jgi:hypothetical protein
MTIEDEVRELFRSAVREVVVPELRSELARPLMLSIRQAPVPRYVILQAEKRGELNVFHVGREAFVAEAEMWEWIRRHGISRKQPRARDDRPPTERGDRQPTGRDEQSSAERDDVSAIVELGERRRRNRSKT